MDDLFIQEEIEVKTEPLDDSAFCENLSEKFILDTAANDDLMAYLNHTNTKEKSFIKRGNHDLDVSSNILDFGSHFMDPDTLIAHYEEVVQDINNTKHQSSDLLLDSGMPLRDQNGKKSERKRKPSHSLGGNTLTTSKGLFNSDLKIDRDYLDSGQFECSLCLFVSYSEADLKNHMYDHIRESDIDNFIAKSFNGTVYTCLFCSFVSSSTDLFRDHIKYKHSKSYSKNSIKVKESTHVIDKGKTHQYDTLDSYFCKFCSAEETSEFGIKQHVLNFHTDKIFKCPSCSFFDFKKSSLKKHICPSSKKYDCPQLDSNTNNVTSSIKGKEKNVSTKIYRCNECSFKGKTRDGLRQHKKLHSGNMPFSCSYCSYKAVKKSRIIRHERIHTGDRPYVCPHCSFRCNQASTLKIHIRRHTGEKPYRCTLCSYRTVSKCSLNAHTKKHNSGNEFNIICVVCSQLYSNVSALEKHILTHNDEPEEGIVKNIEIHERKSNRLIENFAKSPHDKKSNTKKRRNQKLKELDMNEPDNDILSYMAKLYKCTLCSFTCTRFSELSEHMLYHTESDNGTASSDLPKKYRCTPCNMSFPSKDDMTLHVKKRHQAKNKTLQKYNLESEEEIDI